MQLFSSFEDRDSKMSTRTITVRLHDLHDLFAMPRHNAFLDNYLPLSGIDQIAQEMKLMRRHESIRVSFVLPQPLSARALNAANTGSMFRTISGTPLTLLTYGAPVSNDAVTLEFKQPIAANDALRTGTYAKALTYTLSTTTP